MARFSFDGIDEYAAKLYELETSSETMIKRAVYDGAKVVADATRAEISAIPTQTKNPEPGEPLGLLSYEKQGLLNGIGLSQIKNEGGFVNTRIGFSGYNRLKSKTYPNGHPNVLIARALQYGSSIRKKNAFMTRAINASKQKAEEAMSARFDADTKEAIK